MVKPIFPLLTVMPAKRQVASRRYLQKIFINMKFNSEYKKFPVFVLELKKYPFKKDLPWIK